MSDVNNMGFPFCSDCGTSLNLRSSGELICPCCQSKSNLSHLSSSKRCKSATSAPTEQPNWSKSDAEQARAAANSGLNRATIDEPCPKCDRAEVEYYTLQLRSVDEGQTAFYDCPGCGHTWSVNN
mmetsp:Transcript_18429/g.38367  ORF Transcript_18429/g.38367 Transcript_18429/m.38367 type:complete len:125 (-) Transcript_18429:1346-1720(-)